MPTMTTAEFFQYVPFVRMFVRHTQPSSGLVLFRWKNASPPLAIANKRKKNILLASIIEAVSLLILYVLLSPPVAMPLYNIMLFHPLNVNEKLDDQIQKIEQVFNCRLLDVHFKALNGETLHGWYLKNPDAKRTILVSHGNGGCIQHRLALCPLLLQSGCSVLLYDYEGFGHSTGSPSIEKICDDGVAAFDFLVNEQHVKPSNIIAFGESIGCAVTSELSLHRQPGAIVLQSPFTSLREVAEDHLALLRLYPRFLFPKPDMNSLAIMRAPHPPLLLIHGMKDNMLPYEYSQRIYAQAAQPKHIMLLPNADHTDVYKTDVALTMKALNQLIATMPATH